MTVIQSTLFYVVKRFPGHKDTILKFFRENQDFQAICDDYRQCAQALNRWSQSASEKASARRGEYADLLEELDREIIQYLNERKANELSWLDRLGKWDRLSGDKNPSR